MTWPHRLAPHALLTLTLCLLLTAFSTPALAYQLCGNNIVEGSEECDNGQNNSDMQPNACRTDCTRADCGDSVTDAGEQCDDGPYNNDKIPDACRTDCRTAHCGDGVVDPEQGENCEDGNDNPYDGCHQCQVCVALKDDLTIGDNLIITPAQGNVITLCPGTYEFTDQGKEGIVQVTGDNLVINARDVYLVGKPRELNRAAMAPKVNPAQVTQRPGDKPSGPSALVPSRMSKALKATPPSQAGGSGAPAAPTTASAPYGTGFVVTGRNVVIENAALQGFQTAIKLQGSGSALYNNELCGNALGINAATGHHFGADNRCGTSPNWQEGGKPGCTSSCN